MFVYLVIATEKFDNKYKHEILGVFSTRDSAENLMLLALMEGVHMFSDIDILKKKVQTE